MEYAPDPTNEAWGYFFSLGSQLHSFKCCTPGFAWAVRDGDVGTVLPGSRFADVPADFWAVSFIETLADSGITAGCGNGNYCRYGYGW